jgi:hypothetical protein
LEEARPEQHFEKAAAPLLLDRLGGGQIRQQSQQSRPRQCQGDEMPTGYAQRHGQFY